MAKTINFKKVAYQARFGIMASTKLPTPDAFQALNEDEKKAVYRDIFDTWHAVSSFLTSTLEIDDLLNRYCPTEEPEND